MPIKIVGRFFGVFRSKEKADKLAAAKGTGYYVKEIKVKGETRHVVIRKKGG